MFSVKKRKINKPRILIYEKKSCEIIDIVLNDKKCFLDFMCNNYNLDISRFDIDERYKLVSDSMRIPCSYDNMIKKINYFCKQFGFDIKSVPRSNIIQILYISIYLKNRNIITFLQDFFNLNTKPIEELFDKKNVNYKDIKKVLNLYLGG